MQHFSTHPATCSYRLIDGGCEPHRQLDGQYSSLDEAIADAIAWVEPFGELNNAAQMIGVDVSTGEGYWRTCRTPQWHQGDRARGAEASLGQQLR